MRPTKAQSPYSRSTPRIPVPPQAWPVMCCVVAIFLVVQTAPTNAQEPSVRRSVDESATETGSPTNVTPIDNTLVDANHPVKNRYPESDTTSSLTVEQSLNYWKYVQKQIRLRNYDSIAPVLDQLSTASGVPDSIRIAADKTRTSLKTYVRADASMVQASSASDSADLPDNQDTPTSEAEYPESDFSLTIELNRTTNDDKEFRDSGKERLTVHDAKFGLSHKFKFNQHFSSTIELEVSVDENLDEDESSFFEKPDFSRELTYIKYDFSDEALDKELKIGTQKISSEREWWWDDKLDLAALSVENDNWSLTSAIGIKFVDPLFGKKIDAEDEEILRFFGEYTWNYHKEHAISLLLLAEHDQSDRENESDDEDNKLNWLGVGYSGEFFSKSRQPVEYWLDIAAVYGKEIEYDFDNAPDDPDRIETTNVKGWGLDLGASAATDLPGELEFQIGFATTSADADIDDKYDKTFRQTGLQDNNYGLILEPELSNLSILSFGVVFEPVTNIKMAIFYYDFRQVSAADDVRDVDIDTDWNGTNKQIGSEWDVELEISTWDPWGLKFSFGIFEAGNAAEEENASDTVQQGAFELSYEF